MQLNIKINLDNAAYQCLNEEIEYNLEHVINGLIENKTEGKIRDTNGNNVGHWEIEA